MGIPRSFPLMDFERFFLLIHTIPKIWGERIPIVRKKYMGQHKHLKVKVVLNISGDTEIHAIPKAWDE